MNLFSEFWACVARGGGDDCWPWLRAKNPKGYGLVYFAGKQRSAHRVAFWIANTQLPPSNVVIRHRCDNPSCCNPAHLLAGTQRDNVNDMMQRGRNAAARNPQAHRARLRADRIREERWRGESHPAAKLTEDDVRAIRAAQKPTGALAIEYAVSSDTILAIRARRTWRHIA